MPWEREGRNKDVDKWACYILGCSSPGVIDFGDKFTLTAKARRPCSAMGAHWGGYAAGNLWQAECGKCARPWALVARREMKQNKAEGWMLSLEERSIPFSADSAIGDHQEGGQSCLHADRARVQQAKMKAASLSSPRHPASCKGNNRLGSA